MRSKSFLHLVVALALVGLSGCYGWYWDDLDDDDDVIVVDDDAVVLDDDDCIEVCNLFDDCTVDVFDEDECIDDCTLQLSDNDAFQEDVVACAACVGATCESALDCEVECDGVIDVSVIEDDVDVIR